MHTLVTGATGFIGRALTARLATEADTQVAILVREHYRDHDLPEPLNSITDRLVVVYADLRDNVAVRRAVHAVSPDIVFHLAAGGAAEPFIDVDAALEQNLYGLLHLLRACFEEDDAAAPKQFIVVRTPGERSAMNPYAASKAAAWQLCRMYARTREWPVIGAMPFQIYGPGQSENGLVGGAMVAALVGQDFAMTDGLQARDWIYISDVVDGLLAVRDAHLAPGLTVELGTGRTATVAEVVRTIYDMADGGGKPLFGALPTRSGEEALQVADVKRTKALIGWEASLTLEQGLDRYYKYLRRRLG